MEALLTARTVQEEAGNLNAFQVKPAQIIPQVQNITLSPLRLQVPDCIHHLSPRARIEGRQPDVAHAVTISICNDFMSHRGAVWLDSADYRNIQLIAADSVHLQANRYRTQVRQKALS